MAIGLMKPQPNLVHVFKTFCMLVKHEFKDVICVLTSGFDFCVLCGVCKFEDIKLARGNFLIIEKIKKRNRNVCAARKRGASNGTRWFCFVCIFGFSTMTKQLKNISCLELSPHCRVDLPCVGTLWWMKHWSDRLRQGSNTKPSWGPASAIVAVLHSNFWLQWALVVYRLDFSKRGAFEPASGCLGALL